MNRGIIRCVGCTLLAVLAVLLTDVCSAEQGKIFDFWRNDCFRFSKLFTLRSKVSFSSRLPFCVYRIG